MKINNELIKKIYNESNNLKLKNDKDKVKLSEYEEVIPMYDIFSDKIYPVKKENIYYRLIYCHYRFNWRSRSILSTSYKLYNIVFGYDCISCPVQQSCSCTVLLEVFRKLLDRQFRIRHYKERFASIS